jgi:hypothetical protein
MGTAGPQIINDNVVINGYVIANDKTGNFYKQIIIDDGTAAIPILLDAFNLYNDFPIGSRVYLKCKGLYTNFYYKLPQIGFLPDNRGISAPIPFHLWGQFVIKGNEVEYKKPIEVGLSDAHIAKAELFNRLVTIPEVQIQDTSIQELALHPDLSSATNISLMNCDSLFIALRTSAYASFRNTKPPRGRGSITAIYAVFNNTPQLILRDTLDLQMKGTRCTK